MTIITICNNCGAKIGKAENGYGATKADRPWWVCRRCGETTILDPDKQFAEYQCGECDSVWTSENPEECRNCGSHAINQNFIRYVSIREIETLEKPE
jgi:ribosomal protein S27AE